MIRCKLSFSVVAFRFAVMVEEAAVRGRTREKKQENMGCWSTAGMTERSIRLLNPKGRDEAVARKRARNSVKKGVRLGTHRSRLGTQVSHEALTLHSPIAHLAREMRAAATAAENIPGNMHLLPCCHWSLLSRLFVLSSSTLPLMMTAFQLLRSGTAQCGVRILW
jgi:hypothetical protein